MEQLLQHLILRVASLPNVAASPVSFLTVLTSLPDAVASSTFTAVSHIFACCHTLGHILLYDVIDGESPMPPPYFRIHPRSSNDLTLTHFLNPASMSTAQLPVWYLGNTVLKHVLHKNCCISNRSSLTIYVIVFYAGFSPALEVQTSVIFLHFIKVLTIHNRTLTRYI